MNPRLRSNVLPGRGLPIVAALPVSHPNRASRHFLLDFFSGPILTRTDPQQMRRRSSLPLLLAPPIFLRLQWPSFYRHHTPSAASVTRNARTHAEGILPRNRRAWVLQPTPSSPPSRVPTTPHVRGTAFSPDMDESGHGDRTRRWAADRRKDRGRDRSGMN